MGAGDSRSQVCSSCASYHWAYRDQRVSLVTIGSACVPNQDTGHGLVAVPGWKPDLIGLQYVVHLIVCLICSYSWFPLSPPPPRGTGPSMTPPGSVSSQIPIIIGVSVGVVIIIIIIIIIISIIVIILIAIYMTRITGKG